MSYDIAIRVDPSGATPAISKVTAELLKAEAQGGKAGAGISSALNASANSAKLLAAASGTAKSSVETLAQSFASVSHSASAAGKSFTFPKEQIAQGIGQVNGLAGMLASAAFQGGVAGVAFAGVGAAISAVSDHLSKASAETERLRVETIALTDSMHRYEGQGRSMVEMLKEQRDLQRHLGTGAKETAAAYHATRDALEPLFLTTRQQADALTTVTQAMQLNGKTADDAKRFMESYGASLEDGALSAAELKAVFREGPEFVNAFTKATGSSKAELLAMAKEGKLAGDMLRTLTLSLVGNADVSKTWAERQARNRHDVVKSIEAYEDRVGIQRDSELEYLKQTGRLWHTWSENVTEAFAQATNSAKRHAAELANTAAAARALAVAAANSSWDWGSDRWDTHNKGAELAAKAIAAITGETEKATQATRAYVAAAAAGAAYKPSSGVDRSGWGPSGPKTIFDPNVGAFDPYTGSIGATVTQQSSFLAGSANSLSGMGIADLAMPDTKWIEDIDAKFRTVEASTAAWNVELAKTKTISEQTFNGFKAGFESLKQQFDVANASAALVTDGVKGIEDQFISLATKGEASFNDLIESVLAGLARLAFAQGMQGLLGLISPSTPFTDAYNASKGIINGGSHAHGGDYIVPGSGGPDSQRVMFNLTPGEHVRFTPPGRAPAAEMRPVQASPVTVRVINQFDKDELLAHLDTREGHKIILNAVRGRLR